MEFQFYGGDQQGTLRVEKKKLNASKIQRLLEANKSQ